MGGGSSRLGWNPKFGRKSFLRASLTQWPQQRVGVTSTCPHSDLNVTSQWPQRPHNDLNDHCYWGTDYMWHLRHWLHRFFEILWHLRHCLHVTLETLITLLTIENNIIKNYFVIMNRPATGTAFSILEMFWNGNLRPWNFSSWEMIVPRLDPSKSYK